MSIEALASPQSSVPNPAPPPTVGLGPVADAPSSSDTPIKSNVKAFDSEDGPSFSDLLDIINPLQHIPIISTIYRELTGDDEGIIADVIGGGLYGGPIGLMAAMMDLMSKEATGKRIGENVVAMFNDSDDTTVKVADKGEASPASGLAGATKAEASQAAAPDSSEPALAGDYLIFGAKAAPVTTAPLPPTEKTSKVKAVSSASLSAISGKAPLPANTNGYLVFGANADGNTKTETQTAMAAPTGRLSEAKSWPIPARSGAINARQTLPPPTTGPGALPGRASVAVSGNPAPVNDGSGEWFVRAFNQAMDKYQRASRLTEKSGDSLESGSETLH